MPPTRLSASKVRESRYLDLARALIPSLPDGRTEPSESPDFLVHTDNGVVGIEVTRFAWPDRQARPGSNRYAVIRPADLQRVLAHKGRCLRSYSTRGAFTWLIVVIDRKLPRCTGWISPPLLYHRYYTQFVGVALIDFSVGKGWDLAVYSERGR